MTPNHHMPRSTPEQCTHQDERKRLDHGFHKIPESFRAFCRIVSFTAANTRRIFVVSVACVRLESVSLLRLSTTSTLNLLRVEIQLGSVHLIEPPEKVFCGSVDIVATRIIWKIISQRRPAKFLLEQIDLVQEQNDTRPHEPSGIDHRVKKN